MVLERFFCWLSAAPAQSRADAARALVTAYGRLDGDTTRRDNVDRVLAVLLDDPVVMVRQALAEVAASSSDVPRHVVVALSRDVSQVSVPVLRTSRVLTSADLVEALKVGDAAAQVAVAGRASLSAAVSAVLAEDAGAAAVLNLCSNAGAELTLASRRRIVARFGQDGAIREALLQRDDLEAELRLELVLATACVLTDFAVSCAWMSDRRAESVIRDSTEKAAVAIAAAHPRREAGQTLRPFVTYLQAEGRLTPALLLRALVSGDTGLFEAALGQLARTPSDRVTGAARSPSSLAFAALYARAALPHGLLPAFRAALAAANQATGPVFDDLSVAMAASVSRVRAACPDRDAQPAISALLERLEAEGLRESMRQWRQSLATAPQISAHADAPVWLLPRRPVFRLPFRSAA